MKGFFGSRPLPQWTNECEDIRKVHSTGTNWLTLAFGFSMSYMNESHAGEVPASQKGVLTLGKMRRSRP